MEMLETAISELEIEIKHNIFVIEILIVFS